MKKVYISLSADTLHHGHMKLFEEARKHGNIIIGLLTDKAIAEFKNIPYLKFDQRKKILLNIKGVEKIVPQNEYDESINIKKYKPDYVIHGDDWKIGYDKVIRSKVINILDSYGGKLIELPYTKDISSTVINKYQNLNLITPDLRRSSLRRLLEIKNFLRFLETHNPISALIAENLEIKKKGKIISFDGFWSSSLTDSTSMGKPDNEYVDNSLRLTSINHIFDVTSKPLIFDADTGGKIEHFDMKIKTIERTGISAVIMEDKTGLKKNSLLENTQNQKQEEISVFAKKIAIGKKAQVSRDFMIIARIESFILGKKLNDAMKRAEAYLEAGADGIMIHSKDKSPKEVFSFAKTFKKSFKDIPLVCVPSTYNSVKEKELINEGFNIVIYANHMLRGAYPAMLNVAQKILENGRAKEVEKDLQSIKEILNLIPGTN